MLRRQRLEHRDAWWFGCLFVVALAQVANARAIRANVKPVRHTRVTPALITAGAIVPAAFWLS